MRREQQRPESFLAFNLTIVDSGTVGEMDIGAA